MTRSTGDLPVTSRGELTPDRRSRRLWPTIDARRRLNARPTDGIRSKAEALDRDEPRSLESTSARRSKRDKTSLQSGKDELDFHREIVRRAKRAREQAAQSLRLSRTLGKRQGA